MVIPFAISLRFGITCMNLKEPTNPCSSMSLLEKVFILAGLPGAGKSEAAKIFLKMGFTVVRMGDLTDEELRRSGKEKNEENEAKVREYLRRKFSETVYARFVTKRIRSYATANVVIIEGARSLSEVDYLKSRFTDTKIIWLEADDMTRYKRLQSRKMRPLTAKDARKRDRWEKKSMDIEKIKNQADYVIDNNQTLEEFYKNLRLLKLPTCQPKPWRRRG